MTKLATTVDSDGKVWTGAEVDDGPSLGESLFANVLFGGIPALIEAAEGPSDQVTVEVNGQQHTGRRV